MPVFIASLIAWFGGSLAGKVVVGLTLIGGMLVALNVYISTLPQEVIDAVMYVSATIRYFHLIIPLGVVYEVAHWAFYFYGTLIVWDAFNWLRRASSGSGA